jgi:hypothetical protein
MRRRQSRRKAHERSLLASGTCGASLPKRRFRHAPCLVDLKHGLDAANVSFGYTFTKFGGDDFDASHPFVASGDVGLLPGVTLLADLGYNTKDLEATSNGDSPRLRAFIDFAVEEFELQAGALNSAP